MLNYNKKIVKSEGVDIPVMYVYLAGRIAGNCIDKCLQWRHKIINHYANYNEKGTYPISFLDALNSKEADSIDKQGLTSVIPPNLIYDKDMLSVKRADVVVAYMDDFMEEGIENILNSYRPACPEDGEWTPNYKANLREDNLDFDFREAYDILRKKILNRRPNYGTNSEVAWSLWLEKPTILIAGSKRRKEILEKHPFMKRASVIVETVDELLEKKWLNILYKSISSAIY